MTQISSIDTSSKEIADPKMSDQLDQIKKIALEIVDHVKSHPEKSRQIRQFLGYYLPTSVKLIEDYRNFSLLETKTENIRRSMWKIEEMLDTITDAFKRELDGLYYDKAVDISAEIDVMRGMIEREGLGFANIKNAK